MVNIEDIFGTKTQLEIIELYKKNPDAIFHISDISRQLNYAHVTVKKATTKLVRIGFLREFRIGMAIVLMLNRSDELYRVIFEFMDRMELVKEVRTFPLQG